MEPGQVQGKGPGAMGSNMLQLIVHTSLIVYSHWLTPGPEPAQ